MSFESVIWRGVNLGRDDWNFLKGYAENYLSWFNKSCSQLGRLEPFGALYSRRLVRASIYVAEDGVAIFYFSDPPIDPMPQNMPFGVNKKSLLHEGVSVFPNEDVSLTHVLQHLTNNVISILQLPTRQMREDTWQAEIRNRIPPKMPLEAMRVTTVNKAFLEAKIEQGENAQITEIVTGPVLDYEDGYVKNVVPTRKHFIAPILPVQDRLFLLFSWPFLDLFWKPKQLGIDAETSARYAENDLQLLIQGLETEVQFQLGPGLSFSDFHRDPYKTVADQLFDVCQAFERLIDNPATKEVDVQHFLEKKGHQFIVSPVHKEIIPRKRIGHGKYEIDFAVRKFDDDYHLVEIENPNRPIYTAQGEKPAQALDDAVDQVQNWLRYIDDNRDTVRREDGLETIYKPTGEVVVGRDRDLTSDAQRKLDYRRSNSPIVLKTYDMLLTEARTYTEVLRKMSAGSLS